MKKKVLVWETLSTVSGGQKMTLTVMDLLSDTYDFCCLIPSKGLLSDELEKRNIPYFLLGDQTLKTGVKGCTMIFKYGTMSLRSILKSLKIIRKYKPDILYAPGPASLPWSAVCGLLAHRPVIWHLHHIFLDSTTKKLLNVCARWSSVKQIIAVSNCVGSQITNSSAPEKVKVIYNPVNVEKYANGNAEGIIAEIENKLGRKLSGGKALIITHIAQTTKNKKPDLFLQVIAKLNTMGKDVVALMVGTPVTAADHKLHQTLCNYVKEQGLERIVYMMGFRRDINDILAASHIVMIPSSEGLPLVALEAMSAKRKVISVASNGAFELLSGTQCGSCYDDCLTAQDIAQFVVEHSRGERKELENGYEFCRNLSYKKYGCSLKEVFALNE